MNVSDNLRGAFFMMLTMLCFTLGDTFTKIVLKSLPLTHFIFIRGCFCVLFIGLVAWAMGALKFNLSRRDWRLLTLRSVAEAGATFLFLSALRTMDLANATAVLQFLPLSLALAAAVFFREPLGWRRMAAILIGFFGMLLIVRPGTDGFEPDSLYALGAVFCVTIRDLSARRLSKDVPPLMGALIMAVAVAVLSFYFAVITPWEGIALPSLGFTALGAACLSMGYLLLVLAMRFGEIAFVAPFRYTGLVFALIFGFLIFGDFPDGLTLIGAAIVVSTGIFTLYRETVAKRQAKAART